MSLASRHPEDDPGRRRLHRHNETLRALAKSHSDDDAAQIRALTEAAAQSLEVDRASIWFYVENETAIRCADLFDATTKTHATGTELRAREFPEYFEALAAERLIVADDAETDPATRCFADVYLRPLGIASMLDCPLWLRGRVVGVLCHEHVGREPRVFSVEDEAVAGSMADFISAVLESRERRHAEEALRRSRAELVHIQRFDALGRLAAGVAHDFNNSMTAILSYAELVYLAVDNREVRQDIQQIVKAARRASSLTRQLRTFTRQEGSTNEPFDIAATLRDLEQMLARVIGEHVRLHLDLCTEPTWTLGDRRQLEHVMIHLFSNARDAMPNGGTIRARTRREATRIVIEIEDSRPTPTMNDPEVSPGLSMVSDIVDRWGGDIRVACMPAGGALVEIGLPAVEGHVDEPKRPSENADLRGSATVLIVEDDDALRLFAKRSLEGFGYRVHAAADIDEAVALAAEAKQTGGIDLVLSDVALPKANGRAVADRILAMFPDIAVMFVSGYSVEENAKLVGVSNDGVFQKPYTPRELARWVRDVLKHARRRAA